MDKRMDKQRELDPRRMSKIIQGIKQHEQATEYVTDYSEEIPTVVAMALFGVDGGNLIQLVIPNRIAAAVVSEISQQLANGGLPNTVRPVDGRSYLGPGWCYTIGISELYLTMKADEPDIEMPQGAFHVTIGAGPEIRALGKTAAWLENPPSLGGRVPRHDRYNKYRL